MGWGFFNELWNEPKRIRIYPLKQKDWWILKEGDLPNIKITKFRFKEMK